MEPGAVVAEVARRAEIGAGQIYRWRQQLRTCSDGFAQVVIARAETAHPWSFGDANCCAAAPIEVEFGGEARVQKPASIPAALAAAVVKILARR